LDSWFWMLRWGSWELAASFRGLAAQQEPWGLEQEPAGSPLGATPAATR